MTIGNTAVKHDTVKIRRLYKDHTLVGFAGAAADAFALLERLEGRLEEYKGDLKRSAIELAKDWRTDRVLRRLESLLIAADQDCTLIIGGSGDVKALFDDVAGGEVRMLEQRFGSRRGVHAAAADAGHVIRRLDDVAAAADDQRAFLVRGYQQ